MREAFAANREGSGRVEVMRRLRPMLEAEPGAEAMLSTADIVALYKAHALEFCGKAYDILEKGLGKKPWPWGYSRHHDFPIAKRHKIRVDGKPSEKTIN